MNSPIAVGHFRHSVQSYRWYVSCMQYLHGKGSRVRMDESWMDGTID